MLPFLFGRLGRGRHHGLYVDFYLLNNRSLITICEEDICSTLIHYPIPQYRHTSVIKAEGGDRSARHGNLNGVDPDSYSSLAYKCDSLLS